jgi:hypothetical protein
MVPASYVVLDFIPLTHNGKIDRAALPSPSGDRPRLDVAYVPPSSETEKELARIWVDVLGVDRIGIHDNFLRPWRSFPDDHSADVAPQKEFSSRTASSRRLCDADD